MHGVWNYLWQPVSLCTWSDLTHCYTHWDRILPWVAWPGAQLAPVDHRATGSHPHSFLHRPGPHFISAWGRQSLPQWCLRTTLQPCPLPDVLARPQAIPGLCLSLTFAFSFSFCLLTIVPAVQVGKNQLESRSSHLLLFPSSLFYLHPASLWVELKDKNIKWVAKQKLQWKQSPTGPLDAVAAGWMGQCSVLHTNRKLPGLCFSHNALKLQESSHHIFWKHKGQCGLSLDSLCNFHKLERGWPVFR